jgi:DnaJ-class molecular chaperone
MTNFPGIERMCERCMGKGLVEYETGEDICPECEGKGGHPTELLQSIREALIKYFDEFKILEELAD